MIDRLRLFLNRPLSDADRPRLFALAVTVIVLSAVFLALLDRAEPAAERTAAKVRAATPAPWTDAPVAPEASPVVTAAPLSEEGTPAPGTEASRADVAAAKRAARRFLAGYLPYSYGRGRASRIRAATARLRRQLARQRPRVPATERHRHTRVVLLQSDAVSPDRGRLLALVRDGKRRYSLTVELTRRGGHWRVARIGA